MRATSGRGARIGIGTRSLALLLLLLLGLALPLAQAQGGSFEGLPTQLELDSGVQIQLAVLDYGDTGFSGNWSNPVLQSPSGRYQFSLQLADVEDTHFCWVAVVDKSNRRMLRWRAPCNVSVEVDSCKLVATGDGDMQFLTGSGAVAWQTNTSGMGVRLLQLDDTGNFIMKASDGSVIWQTADHPASPPECLISGVFELHDPADSPDPAPPPPPGPQMAASSATAASVLRALFFPLLARCLLGARLLPFRGRLVLRSLCEGRRLGDAVGMRFVNGVGRAGGIAGARVGQVGCLLQERYEGVWPWLCNWKRVHTVGRSRRPAEKRLYVTIPSKEASCDASFDGPVSGPAVILHSRSLFVVTGSSFFNSSLTRDEDFQCSSIYEACRTQPVTLEISSPLTGIAFSVGSLFRNCAVSYESFQSSMNFSGLYHCRNRISKSDETSRVMARDLVTTQANLMRIGLVSPLLMREVHMSVLRGLSSCAEPLIDLSNSTWHLSFRWSADFPASAFSDSPLQIVITCSWAWISTAQLLEEERTNTTDLEFKLLSVCFLYILASTS
ncbi:hypothetical protein AXG93_1881s1340 [Marchantia polymorpha subsp. ruderalis]|uniref:Bulb-type lectin domain-containing protein n=1 Tax=Marchantia polymorpha subsp. ruderalis TaxID=1480154 RepID=A0A176W5P6_MARPO|nr:hypothetical protein AXG93_1881s1340 [Marchantia polymorpha subsp. ruderalis]